MKKQLDSKTTFSPRSILFPQKQATPSKSTPPTGKNVQGNQTMTSSSSTTQTALAGLSDSISISSRKRPNSSEIEEEQVSPLSSMYDFQHDNHASPFPSRMEKKRCSIHRTRHQPLPIVSSLSIKPSRPDVLLRNDIESWFDLETKDKHQISVASSSISSSLSTYLSKPSSIISISSSKSSRNEAKVVTQNTPIQPQITKKTPEIQMSARMNSLNFVKTHEMDSSLIIFPNEKKQVVDRPIGSQSEAVPQLLLSDSSQMSDTNELPPVDPKTCEMDGNLDLVQPSSLRKGREALEQLRTKEKSATHLLLALLLREFDSSFIPLFQASRKAYLKKTKMSLTAKVEHAKAAKLEENLKRNNSNSTGSSFQLDSIELEKLKTELEGKLKLEMEIYKNNLSKLHDPVFSLPPVCFSCILSPSKQNSSLKLNYIGESSFEIEDTASYLLSIGADPSYSNADGVSPILLSVLMQNSSKLLSILLHYGGDVEKNISNLFPCFGNYSYVDLALILRQDPIVIQLLLKNGSMPTKLSLFPHTTPDILFSREQMNAFLQTCSDTPQDGFAERQLTTVLSFNHHIDTLSCSQSLPELGKGNVCAKCSQCPITQEKYDDADVYSVMPTPKQSLSRPFFGDETVHLAKSPASLDLGDHLNTISTSYFGQNVIREYKAKASLLSRSFLNQHFGMPDVIDVIKSCYNIAQTPPLEKLYEESKDILSQHFSDQVDPRIIYGLLRPAFYGKILFHGEKYRALDQNFIFSIQQPQIIAPLSSISPSHQMYSSRRSPHSTSFLETAFLNGYFSLALNSLHKKMWGLLDSWSIQALKANKKSNVILRKMDCAVSNAQFPKNSNSSDEDVEEEKHCSDEESYSSIFSDKLYVALSFLSLTRSSLLPVQNHEQSENISQFRAFDTTHSKVLSPLYGYELISTNPAFYSPLTGEKSNGVVLDVASQSQFAAKQQEVFDLGMNPAEVGNGLGLLHELEAVLLHGYHPDMRQDIDIRIKSIASLEGKISNAKRALDCTDPLQPHFLHLEKELDRLHEVLLGEIYPLSYPSSSHISIPRLPYWLQSLSCSKPSSCVSHFSSTDPCGMTKDLLQDSKSALSTTKDRKDAPVSIQKSQASTNSVLFNTTRVNSDACKVKSSFVQQHFVKGRKNEENNEVENNLYGVSPLVYCVENYLPIPIIALFLRFGADPHSLDDHGICLLARTIMGASQRAESMSELLLAYGSNPFQLVPRFEIQALEDPIGLRDSFDNDYCTVLDIATEFSSRLSSLRLICAYAELFVALGEYIHSNSSKLVCCFHCEWKNTPTSPSILEHLDQHFSLITPKPPPLLLLPTCTCPLTSPSITRSGFEANFHSQRMSLEKAKRRIVELELHEKNRNYF